MSEGESRGPLEPGRVVKGVFQALGRHWLWLLAVAFVLSFLPHLASGYVYAWATRGQSIGPLSLIRIGERNWIAIGVNIIPTAILLSLVIRRVTAEAGAPPTPPLAGLSRAPMVLVTHLMTIIGVGLAYLLLIVPGVVLSIVWSVAVPVVVVEKGSPPNCFERSADLTRNHRWRIFFLGLIYSVGVVVIGFVLGVLIGIGENALRQTISIGILGFAATCATSAIAALTATLGCLGMAVLYRELVTLKHGAAAPSLASVFD